MNYQAELNSQQTIHLQNEGEQTSVAISGDGQNQSSSFSTGKWSEKPQLWSVDEGFIVQISSEDGEKFLSVQNNGVQSLDQKPDLKSAKKLDLKESDAKSEPPLKPMAPMKPMEPMKPLN